MLASTPLVIAHSAIVATAPLPSSVAVVASAAAQPSAIASTLPGLLSPSPLIASAPCGSTDESVALSAALSAQTAPLPPLSSASVAALHPSQISHAAEVMSDSVKCRSSYEIASTLTTQPQPRSFKDGGDNREKHRSMPSSAQIASNQRATLIPHTNGDQSKHQHGLNSNSAHVQHTRMEMDSEGDEKNSAAAPSAASASSSSAASALLLSSNLPASSPHPSPASGRIHPSRTALLNIVGSSLPLPQSSRSSAPISSAASNVRMPRAASSKPSWLISLCSPAMLEQQKRASASSAAASSSSAASSSQLDSAAAAVSSSLLRSTSVAHCLVFDTALFDAQSNDSAQFAQVLSAHPKPDQMKARVQAWHPALKTEDFSCVFKDTENRVHVQFKTREAMAAALIAVKSLVQCCVTASASAWQRTRHCGVERHHLPERIDLECNLNAGSNDENKLAEGIKSLLAALNMDVNAQWRPSNIKLPHFVLSLIPRDIRPAALTATVNRINASNSTLFGSLVQADAPNTPSLSRCSQCCELGHSASACPQYGGVALRILFNNPVPFAVMEELQRVAQAARAYLGNDFDQRMPHRKVTLLFDDLQEPSEEHGDHMQQIGSRGLMAHLSSIESIIADCTIVRVGDRLRECKECGNVNRSHECSAREANRPIIRMRKDQQSVRQQQPASAQPGSASASSADSMCFSWRKTKRCPRRERGERCHHHHPADHEVKRAVCFEWRSTGQCKRGGNCRFLSSHTPPATAPAAAQSQPAASASVPLQSLAASSAAASASVVVNKSDEANPFTPVVNRSRGRPRAAAASSAAAAAAASTATSAPRGLSKKRGTATAGLSTPLITPEQTAARSVFSSPSAALSWGDTPMTDDEEVEPQAAAAAPSAAPISSLSMLSSPTKAKPTATPKHTQKKQNTTAAAAAPSSSSSSSASAQRSLSFSASSARSSSRQEASTPSLPPTRHSSESGQGKSSNQQ